MAEPKRPLATMATPIDVPGTIRLENAQQAKALVDAAMRAGGFDRLGEGDLKRIMAIGRPENADETSPSGKPSKYRNVRFEVDGVKFQSKKEAAYWHGLKLREKAGEIQDLQRQVAFDLKAPVEDSREDGMYCAVVVSQYLADYVYRDAAGTHVVDAKGKRTKEYDLKRKWLELQSNIVIEEV